jgi:hypothetical protein
MALLRGKLLGGALFAGALFGATLVEAPEVVVPTPVAAPSGGGWLPSSVRKTVRAVPDEATVPDKTSMLARIHDEDEFILQLIISSVTQELV